MSNDNYSLLVDGINIPLRRVDSIRFVTPSRNEHPMAVASRLAKSSRIAIEPTSPHDVLIVRGESQKLQEIRSYRDIQNTRCSFQDSQGNLLILTNDILISFVEGSEDRERYRLIDRIDGRLIKQNEHLWKIQINDSAEDIPLLLANELCNESIVNYAEPNAIQSLKFHQLPQNEPRFGNQWTFENTGQNGGTVGADVNAIGAWAITTGSPDVGIVVHDSGVDVNHPDLIANIGPGRDFDNNDDNATNNGGPHGTACAGIIAAAINNRGVVGIAPNCQIIPLRAASRLSWEVWAETFDWAASRGRIISCSWSITPNNTLSSAIRRAVNNGVTVVCAAGNDGIGRISYPANMVETIAVGASTNRDVRSSYSQFGNGLDFVAPSSGGTLRVETTDNVGVHGYNNNSSPAGDYCNADDDTGFGGTSAATPLVAGIAGLMLSINPSLAPDDIRRILRETADKIDPADAAYDANGWSNQYGFGRVNASRAVRRASGGNVSGWIEPILFELL